jgi:hypothetical protein
MLARARRRDAWFFTVTLEPTGHLPSDSQSRANTHVTGMLPHDTTTRRHDGTTRGFSTVTP